MAEGPLTPLVPASHVPEQFYPEIQIPENERQPVEEHGVRRVAGGDDDPQNHRLGALGEYAVDRFLGGKDTIDLTVYPDGGDGGFDLKFANKTIDVKTASRTQSEPALFVGAGRELTADYYVLVHRVSVSRFKLVGYCPRHFVANSTPQNWGGDNVHVVSQEDLFPFPKWTQQMSAQHVG